MTQTTVDDLLYFNGLDGTTGSYLAKPVSLTGLRDQAHDLARQDVNLWDTQDHLNNLLERNLMQENAFDLNRDIQADDLSQAGWGMIFPERAEKKQVEAILEALDDLITLRRDKVGARFHIYYGEGDGYRPGETGEEFASRHGVENGAVDPEKMPFYLLIVADPLSIPFSFQYQLDVQFAVGRIYFESLDEYAQYARSVLTAESEPAQVCLPRKAVFVKVANQDDKATQLSAEQLITPLYEYSSSPAKKPAAELGWTAEVLEGDQARKTSLLDYLGGQQTPALLFSASHGLGWPSGHPLQQPFQGALVCQDWPGPAAYTAKALPEDFFLGGRDIASDASLLGTVAFFFACFGAGTPHLDDFATARGTQRKRLAERPFLADLPRRMLSHPRGGALAVIGHVERAWGYSFHWRSQDAEPESFKNFLYESMRGMPIGYALESLNNRYGIVATRLSDEMEKLKRDANREPYTVARLWMTNNDARAYVILGDPAVHLPLAPAQTKETQRPAIAGVQPGRGALPAVLVAGSLDEDGRPFTPEPVANPAAGPAQPGGSSAQGADPAADPPPAMQVVVPASPMDELAKALEKYQNDPVNYGVGEDLQKLVGPVVKNLFEALSQTAQKLQTAAQQATTLEITTAIVDDLNQFEPQNPAEGDGGVEKRFVTTIGLTGDVHLYLSPEAADSDEGLLDLHKAMVSQAQTNRLEMTKTLGELIASLFGGGK